MPLPTVVPVPEPTAPASHRHVARSTCKTDISRNTTNYTGVTVGRFSDGDESLGMTRPGGWSQPRLTRSRGRVARLLLARLGTEFDALDISGGAAAEAQCGLKSLGAELTRVERSAQLIQRG